MVTKTQCPAHTRTPWGSSPHRYDPRLRYLAMAIILLIFLGIIVYAVISLITAADRMKNDAQSLPPHVGDGKVDG
ncbi:hypothetical protein NLU13_4210 [Sarocladium strictum]|uniref:Uncharacterized protein n=1 Tax=Sarocladium strictum TaxID=5046 RepID=A0AA39GIT0_SARSR|nr:hypothetical protein NLU13_4210 [Sarocladium strictum]